MNWHYIIVAFMISVPENLIMLKMGRWLERNGK